MMDVDKALEWLKELEIYFQKLSLSSNEDITVQSYTQNALNAKKVEDLLRKYRE